MLVAHKPSIRAVLCNWIAKSIYSSAPVGLDMMLLPAVVAPPMPMLAMFLWRANPEDEESQIAAQAQRQLGFGLHDVMWWWCASHSHSMHSLSHVQRFGALDSCFIFLVIFCWYFLPTFCRTRGRWSLGDFSKNEAVYLHVSLLGAYKGWFYPKMLALCTVGSVRVYVLL